MKKQKDNIFGEEKDLNLFFSIFFCRSFFSSLSHLHSNSTYILVYIYWYTVYSEYIIGRTHHSMGSAGVGISGWKIGKGHNILNNIK